MACSAWERTCDTHFVLKTFQAFLTVTWTKSKILIIFGANIPETTVH